MFAAVIAAGTLAACGSRSGNPTPGLLPCSLGVPFVNPLSSMGIVGKAGTFGALRWEEPNWSVHTGVDLNAPLTNATLKIGVPVYAVAAGKVLQVSASDVKVYGLRVVIRHAGGVQSLYAHLYKALVKPDAVVSRGEQIAISGQSGNASDSSEPPHLHFELSNGKPLLYPDSAQGVVVHDNVVNPCKGQTSTGGTTVSVYGNVKVTSATLDGRALTPAGPQSFRVSRWPIGVRGSHKAQFLSHTLEIRTIALCDGVYSVGIAPKESGLIYQFRKTLAMPFTKANIPNGNSMKSAVIVYQNPGFHEKLLDDQIRPTPAPNCAPQKSRA